MYSTEYEVGQFMMRSTTSDAFQPVWVNAKRMKPEDQPRCGLGSRMTKTKCVCVFELS